MSAGADNVVFLPALWNGWPDGLIPTAQIHWKLLFRYLEVNRSHLVSIVNHGAAGAAPWFEFQKTPALCELCVCHLVSIDSEPSAQLSLKV